MIIRTRGASSQPILCEFRCPVHGVFEALVERAAAGDPPPEVRCPADDDCYDCGGQPSAPGARRGGCPACNNACHPCGCPSPWTISAPKPKVWSRPCVAAVRGGDMKDRPRGMLDTRPLAEGMSLETWKAQQRTAQIARRHEQLVKAGVVTPRIQVGGGT